MKPPKPNPSQTLRSEHSVSVMSAAQAKRVAKGGNWESMAAEKFQMSEEDRIKRAARHAVEDRRMARELGIE